MPPDTSSTRFGTIVLAGKPNVGKSTLLNALVGEKLAIVSPKAQSTRSPVMGLVTDRDCQLLFVDPPGLLEPTSLMQEAMLDCAAQALQEANAALLLHPLSSSGSAPTLGELVPTFRETALPVATVFTKADLCDDAPISVADGTFFVVSAETGQGVPELLDWCRKQAPPGEFRYDPEDLGTQPLRFFVAELVREAAFDHLEQELPYSMAALVDEFRENQEPVYIRVILYVERESQKGLVIGKDGRTIKAIGAAARSTVEELLGQRVYLDLWVKVLSKWRKSPRMLQMFGLTVTSTKGKRA
jgi:GTP-binding protein Era